MGYTTTAILSAPEELTTISGTVSTLGNNTLITPSSGKKVRVYYVMYNPVLATAAAFRFGAAGPLWLLTSIGAGAVIAKNFGDFRYLEGAADEALILNLSVGVSTNWNCNYLEV